MKLVHSAVPYPVLLIVMQDKHLSLSLAHKRWSQSESDKVVVDGAIVEVALESQVDLNLEFKRVQTDLTAAKERL